MKIKPIKTKIFKEGDDLLDFIRASVRKLEEGSILVVTSKIVSLSEKRVMSMKSEKEMAALIRKESQFALRSKYVWLTIKDGMVQASAGIDKSNARGKIILAPRDSFKTASLLRKKLMEHYGLKNLGIIISDSQLVPLRAGVIGIALGYAGFKGLRDYRGTQDLFGRIMKFSSTNVADGLATAATLLMGEGNERQPLAVITDSPVAFARRTDARELKIPRTDDMFWPLFKKAKNY